MKVALLTPTHDFVAEVWPTDRPAHVAANPLLRSRSRFSGDPNSHSFHRTTIIRLHAMSEKGLKAQLKFARNFRKRRGGPGRRMVAVLPALRSHRYPASHLIGAAWRRGRR